MVSSLKDYIKAKGMARNFTSISGRQAAFLCALLLTVVAFTDGKYIPRLPDLIILVLFFWITILFIYGLYIRLQHLITQQASAVIQANRLDYQNAEALITILSPLSTRLPLPPTRGWAASPDFLRLIVNNILTHKPQTVVELGSGVSTLYSGYALEKNGFGKLYSIDHDQAFLAITARNAEAHQLDGYIEFIHAPLTPIPLGQQQWIWYADMVARLPEINLLVVDGPPGNTQNNARYPALPLLYAKLAPNAIIVVDDYNREQDKATVAMWLKQFPDLSLIEIENEKGAAILLKGEARI
ncbi:O-methyltransferase [Hymenobacter sp. BT730]|uniref:O-methyltransferase n=1 Tax=Hymenobacter sp. BT730 TaxID=3063332 RepID=UPI0026E042D9|nr:class I SAM-dependent methyltransferase [Hymenobacter sp. BT730]